MQNMRFAHKMKGDQMWIAFTSSLNVIAAYHMMVAKHIEHRKVLIKVFVRWRLSIVE